MKFILHKFFGSILLYIIVIVSIASCAAEKEPSFQNIVTNPRYFEEKIVTISGFFRPGLGLFLYPDVENIDPLNFESAIQVEDKSINDLLVGGCEEQFIQIEGRIQISSLGIAKITDFEEVFSITSNMVCWKSNNKE